MGAGNRRCFVWLMCFRAVFAQGRRVLRTPGLIKALFPGDDGSAYVAARVAAARVRFPISYARPSYSTHKPCTPYALLSTEHNTYFSRRRGEGTGRGAAAGAGAGVDFLTLWTEGELTTATAGEQTELACN